MKSAETHPTPPNVLAAIDTIGAWLRTIGAAEAHIRPNGGAAFHLETHVDQVERLHKEWNELVQAACRDRDQKQAIISRIDKRSGTLPKPSTLARRYLKSRNHPAFRKEGKTNA